MNEKSNQKRMGRPPLTNPNEKRDKRLPVIQVSEKELNTYKQASEREGKTFSAWVRGVLDGASKE